MSNKNAVSEMDKTGTTKDNLFLLIAIVVPVGKGIPICLVLEENLIGSFPIVFLL